MGSIITLDKLGTEAALAPTVDNFPALTHFFNAETMNLGATSWVDSVNGVTVPMTVVSDGVDDFSRTTSSNPTIDAPLSDGAWVQPGLKPVVMIAMGAHNNKGWIIGSSVVTNNSDAIRLVSVVGNGGIYDNSVGTKDVFDDLTVSSKSMVATGFDIPNNSINSHEYNGTILTSNTANAIVNATQINQIGSVAGFNATEHYGLAIFHFEKLPEDIPSAIAWMYERWVVGEKVIWPGWRGRN